MARKQFYSFKASAGGAGPHTLSIFDEIGFWGTNAADFARDLKAVTENEIVVEINSPGGSVFDGIAIYNMLRAAAASGKKITSKVMGVAASIASVILLAGDKIVMPANSMVMVHSPSGGVFGTAEEMRDMADVLDKVKKSLVATYVKRTGLSEDEVVAMLAKDTWLTADEAKEKGFADEVVDAVELTASFDVTDEALPATARAAFKAAADKRAADEAAAVAAQAKADKDAADAAAAAEKNTFAAKVTGVLTGTGFEAHAAAWALKYTKVEDVSARVAECREIKALFELAKKPDLVASLITAGKTLDEARIELQNALAADDTHIDTTRKTDDEKKAKAPNSGGVYAKRAGASTGTSTPPTSAVSAAAIWAKRNK